MAMRITMKPLWKQQIERGLKTAVLEMALDVHRRAVILAPVLRRHLVGSGIIQPINKGYMVKFGSAKVPYARRRHFENKKNPQTIGYLAKAGDSVARGDKSKYFRGKV